MSLLPTCKMMCDMVAVVTDMERHGIAIDLAYLATLRKEYEERVAILEKELHELATEANGGIPINLNSPEQKSQLIFSRRVKDKKKWAEVWNLGSEARGSVKKKKRQYSYPHKDFVKIVKGMLEVVPQYTKTKCDTCNGSGKTLKKLKDGSYSSTTRNCPVCGGATYTLEATNKVAGFKCVPKQHMVSAAGFSTDKETLEELAQTAHGKAKEFLTRVEEYNKLSHYLSTFILPIERHTRADGILHSSFMQTVTATGRISSQNPNFHNQPRADKLPIRRCIVSRFRGGYIGEGDYAQLEFRCAVELANDPVGLQDILEKVDAHSRTATIVSEAGQPTKRQEAKALTFKPLYGGNTGSEAEKVYYKFFEERYPRIHKWHTELCNLAVSKRVITLPTGRQLAFPNVVRYPSGTVSSSTQIKNYPVQSYATADIVPVATIEAHRLFLEHGLKSVIINEIHDSIVVDIHPEEKEIALSLLARAMNDVPSLMRKRYGIELKVPLEVELKVGSNWMDTTTYSV